MSNPQQPEVRRSEQTPSQSPDSIKGEDQPDLDDFAAKFGIDEAPAASATPDESTMNDASTRPGAQTTAHQRSGTDVALDAIGTVVTTGVRLVKPLVGTARELFVNWRQRSSR